VGVPSFAARVTESLAATGREKRTWVAGDARAPLVSFSSLGIPASPELVAYAKAAERLA
jgi:hypothetical protein